MAFALDERIRNPFYMMSLVGFVGGTLAVGMLGAYFTSAGLAEWYGELARPPFTPPDGVFGPVWSVLYVMMALSLWLVWSRGTGLVKRQVLAIYAAQLGLNLLWSILFFYFRSPLFALSELVILLFTVLVMTRFYWWRSPLAGALLVPYVLWLMFATYLNFGFWLLNTPVI